MKISELKKIIKEEIEKLSSDFESNYDPSQWKVGETLEILKHDNKFGVSRADGKKELPIREGEILFTVEIKHIKKGEDK